MSNAKFSLAEDWAIVLLGFLIIGSVVFGVALPIPTFGWKNGTELLEKVLALPNLLALAGQLLFSMVVLGLGAWLTQKPIKNALIAFPGVYFLGVVALVVAGNAQVKAYNLEAVIFSLAIGLALGNLFQLPTWFRATLSAEFFVKIGLVLLGTTVIFSDLLKAGALGLAQSLVVVVGVWYVAYWLCRQFKVDEELTMMIASAVSICGVSAAIATAGAIQGDAKKLSYTISLVLITAIPMMVVMPYLANWWGLSPEVAGAWLGGSIDTTGAVVAAGSLVGDTALKISTIVKFSQNVLLGLAAFAISVYWTYTKRGLGNETKPTLSLIWERFPKFVIGFLLASALFSFGLAPVSIAHAKDGLKTIQTLWFVLAFTSIGLETKFSDLFSADQKKPLYAFLLAQTFNILLTLAIALLLFN